MSRGQVRNATGDSCFAWDGEPFLNCLKSPTVAATAEAVTGPTPALALGGLAVMRLQAFQLLINLLVALTELRANKVKSVQRLFERKQVLGTPVALQAPGGLLNGTTAASPSCQRPGSCYIKNS